MYKESDLTKGDISKHIKNIALPASIGYFFHTMFNVTDTYFAGHISSVALAALSFNFSIFFMIIAIAGGMSQGTTALVRNTLGENDNIKAKNNILNSFVFALFLSLVLTLLGYFVSPFLLVVLGAKGEYLKESLAYIDIILLQGIKKPSFLVTLGILRQIIIPVIVFMILKFFKLPIIYYWISMALTIWFSAYLIMWYSKQVIKF